MPTLNIPISFVNGTVADANQVNTDFTAVAGVVNGLDFANVGANGFYANQIIPTAPGQAQFGGAFGYSFNCPTVSQVPLTVRGSSGQTADLFDVFAGANKLAWIDNAGNFNTPGIVCTGSASFSGSITANGATINGNLSVSNQGSFGSIQTSGPVSTGAITATNITASGAINAGVGNAGVAGDGGFARSTSSGAIGLGGSVSSALIDWNITSANLLSINKPTNFTASGSTFKNLGVNGVVLQTAADGNAALFCVNNAANSASLFRVDSVDATHGLAVVNRGGVLGALLPMLTAAGGSITNTVHGVTGTVTAAGASTTITLAGSAAFTSGQAWIYLVFDATAGTMVTTLTGLSNTGFTFASTTGHVYMYFAIGV